MINNNILNAKKYFYQRKYRLAFKFFSKEKDYYSCGLCPLLLKKKHSAKKFWYYSKDKDPASDWGLCILNFIDLKPDRIPTFFQTRAQLETYLNIFIENNLLEWAQNLVSCADTLYYANPESYKFIARALYSSGYFELAITFCKKSLNVFYSDPEALLVMAQCYYLLNDIEKAEYCTNKILDITKNYYPAILFREIIEEKKRES